MPKTYDMWIELKVWLEIQNDRVEHDGYLDTLNKMEWLESEYE